MGTSFFKKRLVMVAAGWMVLFAAIAWGVTLGLFDFDSRLEAAGFWTRTAYRSGKAMLLGITGSLCGLYITLNQSLRTPRGYATLGAMQALYWLFFGVLIHLLYTWLETQPPVIRPIVVLVLGVSVNSLNDFLQPWWMRSWGFPHERNPGSARRAMDAFLSRLPLAWGLNDVVQNGVPPQWRIALAVGIVGFWMSVYRAYVMHERERVRIHPGWVAMTGITGAAASAVWTTGVNALIGMGITLGVTLYFRTRRSAETTSPR